MPVLTGGPRDAPIRLQTMRNAIAWSHELLSAVEQALFRRLAVFVGGFALAGAEQVARGGESLAPIPDPLDRIAALVDHGLVTREPERGVWQRYRMLETIREFGREQLIESGEEPEVQRSHAAYFLQLAAETEPGLVLPGHEPLLARLEAELANLRAALAWFLDDGDTEAALRLAGSIALFWDVHGPLSEGRDWLERALAAGGDHPAPTAGRALALTGAGLLARGQGDYGQAVAWEKAALAIWQRLGDAKGIADAHHDLGHIALSLGEYDRSETEYKEAVALYRQLEGRTLGLCSGQSRNRGRSPRGRGARTGAAD